MDSDLCGERARVQHVEAVHVTAGPEGVREPGPDQTSELWSPDSIQGFLGTGPV